MPAPLSLDLRERVLEACRDRLASQRAVAQRFRVSLGFVEKLLRRHRSTGLMTPGKAPGRARSLTPDDEATLIERLEQHNDATIAELTDGLSANTGRRVSTSAVSRTLVRLNLTRKKRRFGPASNSATT